MRYNVAMRRIEKSLAIISLLLAAGFLALAVLGLGRQDHLLACNLLGRKLYLDNLSGAMEAGWVAFPPFKGAIRPFAASAHNTRLQFIGVVLEHFEYPIVGWTATVPHVLLILFFGGYPLLWWLSETRRRTRERLASHLCVRCGYDLRATPLRCPECGRQVD